ncbi:hypothetical protein [Cyanothece sp. BG0011]|uniref:hypothetical protein n=1 Tax=Cyanothece sp. BG0011 TaxID=2082950 RepID=UPI000D1F4916|nr:hypothetical protein [Cyanothece sp. BG0011]
MLISDIQHLETVVETDNIEGGGAAELIADILADVDAQSDAFAFVFQEAEAYAFTGLKEVSYASTILLEGLT